MNVDQRGPHMPWTTSHLLFRSILLVFTYSGPSSRGVFLAVLFAHPIIPCICILRFWASFARSEGFWHGGTGTVQRLR